MVEFNANLVSAQEIFDQTRALQVFPNPSDNMTTAAFYLVTASKITLNLFNSFGQKVWTYGPVNLPGGAQAVEINTGNLTPGVYVLQLSSGDKMVTRKLTVTR